MKFRKSFKHALNMVLHAKIRSWLTILGIVIGVAAVIAIVSLSESLREDVTNQLGQLGGDLLTIRAGSSGANSFFGGHGGDFGGGGSSASTEEIVLDRTDLQVLRGIQDIKVMDTEISGRVDVYNVAEKGSATLTGVDPAAWYQLTTGTIAEGRMLGPADSNVVVVGGRIADGFFTKQLGVNQLITIEDRLFRIVGILDDTGSNIFMPITAAYDILDDKDRDVYDQIVIKVKNEDELDAAIEHIDSKLRVKRHVLSGRADFSISSNKERQAQRSEMMSSMTTFLTAIAAVALLVGAVGVANTMFTSVLEKTKEIGIMKAIGARNSDILTIFLLHAALIGFIGGALGIALGYVLSGLLPSLMGSAGGPLSRFAGGGFISISSILMAMGISIFIGMAAGAVPAVQASKLKPVDALRY
ncbi:MAG: ABC transporter permease, partial [Nanoarchaeota archaeon]|nr:ABC transporter permease [Nanoarchaeota archaeon]